MSESNSQEEINQQANEKKLEVNIHMIGSNEYIT